MINIYLLFDGDDDASMAPLFDDDDVPDGNRFINSSCIIVTTLRIIWSTSPNDTCLERF